VRHAAQLGNPSTPSAKLTMHKRPSLMRLWKLMLDPVPFPLRPEMLMSEPNTGSKATCSMQVKSLWQMFVYIVLLFAPRNAKVIWHQYQRLRFHVPITSIAWLRPCKGTCGTF